MLPEAESAPAAKRATPLRLLKVGGVAPFTATDYPGQLAAVLFVQGCPWRCGYCHNTHLQPRTREGAVSWAKVMSFLARRVGLIDAVVFSGGEPTSDPALARLFRPVYPQPHWHARGSEAAELDILLDPALAAFDGHFPQAAILPGVAQLDWAIHFGREAFAIECFHFRTKL